MIILACLITVTLNGKSSVVALTGELLGESKKNYVVDFTNALNSVYGTDSDGLPYVLTVPKDQCIKKTR